MSDDIDMKNYAGALPDSAAADQPIVDTNSYQQELQSEEFPVQKDLLEQTVKEEVASLPSKQELNFHALREEVDRIKAEKKELEYNLELLRANVQRPQEQSNVPRDRKMFEGMNDDEIPNVSEIRKEWDVRESQYQARIEELEVAQKFPDYAEVIEKYALPLVKQKPHLADGIRGANNKALFAYELGKMAQQMHVAQSAPPQRSSDAQRMIENSRKPGTLAQTGGQGALSKADYYASMSDTEFMKLATANLGAI